MFLGEPAPRLSGIEVGLVRVWAFVAFDRGKHIPSHGYVLFADHDFKSRAGPRQVLTHSSRGVGLDHGLNAGVFERAFRQLSFDAATV